MRTSKSKF